MNRKTMSPSELEAAYELIARAVDDVGPERERLFLGKLALALAHECADLARVEAAVQAARRRLDEATVPPPQPGPR